MSIDPLTGGLRLTCNYGSGHYLYLMERGDLLKIGHSKSPWKRRDQIQRRFEDPVDILCDVVMSRPVAKMYESSLHRLHAAGRQHGEWFDRDDAIFDDYERLGAVIPWRCVEYRARDLFANMLEPFRGGRRYHGFERKDCTAYDAARVFLITCGTLPGVADDMGFLERWRDYYGPFASRRS